MNYRMIERKTAKTDRRKVWDLYIDGVQVLEIVCQGLEVAVYDSQNYDNQVFSASADQAANQ